MLLAMLGAIFIGFPISFTLLLLALIFGWIGLGDRAFYIMVFQTIGLMKEEVLAAVPLFIFMGYLMEQGGLMERLFRGFQLVMGPVMGVSVAALYASCFGPGFLLAGIFIVYCLVRSIINPRLGPLLPPEERTGSILVIAKELTLGMLPHAILIIATLGTIIWGWATPTEAAAMGVVGAAFLAVVYGQFT